MIVIVDYGMGNLRSVQKAFERIRYLQRFPQMSMKLLLAEKLVLPGVGHFEQGINNLKDRGLFETLNEVVIGKKIPILGICLGMQLMTDFSEEGNCNGFGWIKARTQRFSFQSDGLKIPHMGWNNLSLKKADSLFKGYNYREFFLFRSFIFCFL